MGRRNWLSSPQQRSCLVKSASGVGERERFVKHVLVELWDGEIQDGVGGANSVRIQSSQRG
jgi:hypothetical protein